jgi:diadenosine hexaphosphate hydrolase (ATP-forming)
MVQRTAVSAGAIILRETTGELKLALAHHKNSAKEWVLPKGHVDPGESLEQAALREIHEETGLARVQLIKHLGTIVRQSLKSNGDVEDKTIHYFLAYALDNDQSQTPLDPRFTGVGWFSPLQAIELIPYEQDRAFLQEHLSPMLNLN